MDAARREFQFVEGTSSKFWAIILKETSLTVHYGKINTTGTAQEKSFPNADAAKKEYDKLILEKTKKGYTEVANAANVFVPHAIVKAAPAPKAATPEPEPAPAVESMKSNATTVPVASESQTTPSATAAPTQIVRKVHLTPEQWSIVSWRPPVYLKRPEPRPFDREVVLNQAAVYATYIGRSYRRGPLLPTHLTKEESWLWLQMVLIIKEAKTFREELKSFEEIDDKKIRELVQEKVDIFVSTDYAARSETRTAVLPELPQLLYPFFSHVEVLKIQVRIRAVATAPEHQNSRIHSLRLYRSNVFLYANAEERQEMKKFLQSGCDPEGAPPTAGGVYCVTLLSLFGPCPELDRYVAQQVPGVWNGYGAFDYALLLLAGLPDEERFVAEAVRLTGESFSQDFYSHEETSYIWLAATEWRQLNYLKTQIVNCNAQDRATTYAQILALVEAPEAAALMLEIKFFSKASLVGTQWLAKHPLLAAVGLVATAMGRGKVAERAVSHLQSMRREGQLPILQSALPHLSAREAEWLVREVINHTEEVLPELSSGEIPASLATAIKAMKPAKPSAWLTFSSLPAIRIGSKKLGKPAVEAVLAALKETELGAASPIISELKKIAEPNSLDAFAWQLFDQWNTLGAPSKDKWAMGGVGHLGGDACVLKLTPLVRAWPGESQHQRAVFGLQCLRTVGSDTALMALNGIALKLPFKALKEKAQVLMEEIATSRGLTREELADRIVPDCDLDERGSRTFDFGPRQFKFALGEDLKPLIRDSEGKLLPDLPKPKSTDDAAKAEAAVADWKVLKKTLKEVMKVQADRLEDGMITGRRWKATEFDQLLVKHPLMINLIRLFVMGVYDSAGKVTQTFRVTEDQTLANESDDPFTLAANGVVGLVHPAHLAEGTLNAWGEVLSDYAIIPPFQQLGRAICRANADELEKETIERFKGKKIEGRTFYGILQKNQWQHDSPADGGGFAQHLRYFPSANLTAFISYEPGMAPGYYEEKQEITAVYFRAGKIEPKMWGGHKTGEGLKIKEVDMVVLSEVLRLANALVSKAE